MGVILGLLAALSYGGSDFVAGLAGRRSDPVVVAVIAQPFGLLAALLVVAVHHASPPSVAALAWGAASGVGSGIGTAALYWGLSRAPMSVVAPLSAVVSSAVPAAVGVLTGDRLSTLAWIGILAALPAVTMVSASHDHGGSHASRRTGVFTGLAAGLAFALLFIALARAGTDSGAWPLVPGQVVANAVILATALAGRSGRRRNGAEAVWRRSLFAGVFAGVLGGAANLLYLAATGAGQLAVVAVVTALYPALTVILARFTLGEQWSRVQATGLVLCAAAVAMISAG